MSSQEGWCMIQDKAEQMITAFGSHTGGVSASEGWQAKCCLLVMQRQSERALCVQT